VQQLPATATRDQPSCVWCCCWRVGLETRVFVVASDHAASDLVLDYMVLDYMPPLTWFWISIHDAWAGCLGAASKTSINTVSFQQPCGSRHCFAYACVSAKI
jgi:hypothetical protein